MTAAAIMQPRTAFRSSRRRLLFRRARRVDQPTRDSNRFGRAGFALVKRFADAHDRRQSCLERSTCFRRHELRAFRMVCTALGVADDSKFRPEIEPVVRLIEDTPRDRSLEVMIAQLKKGLSYKDLLAGLFLAGIRNIKPRPVGFKFHAVMVIN